MRSITFTLAVLALVALGGRTLAQTAGADISFGGFDYAGGVAESGDAALVFSGTEFGASALETGPVALPGFAVVTLCVDDGDGLSYAREETSGTDPCTYDTDSDGLADGRDVEFIQTALNALSPAALGGQRAPGIRTAATRILDDVERSLLRGDVRTADRELRDLLRRFDGCVTKESGAPDPNDWIVTCHDQLALRADLTLLVQNIGP